MAMAPLTEGKAAGKAREAAGLSSGEGPMSKGCKSYAVDLSAYFDGELEGDSLERMERHLDGCEGCRDTLERLGKLRSALHSLARPPRRRNSILDELKARMEEEEDPPKGDDPMPC